MFAAPDVLDELDAAVGKVGASEQPLDIERIWRIAERVEFLKVRAVREYELSAAWQADGFVSTASALRAKVRAEGGAVRSAVTLGRKLEQLPEVAAAFEAGDITRHHAALIAAAYTAARAEMISSVEAGFVEVAKIVNPERLRDELKKITDAFDGDGGAGDDERQHALNKVTLSATSQGRGVLNGSLDAELARIVEAAFDAEMHALQLTDDPRTTPQRRAEALESMCRRSLDHHDDGTRRRRGQPHLSLVQDISRLEGEHPDLVADMRHEASQFGMLSRTTLERMCCTANISRVIADGPSQILDVGRMTRDVSGPLWTALVARDEHCTTPGCDRPPSHCDAHHIWFWEWGGPTNLANLKLLCWYHHKELHIHDAKARAG